jgi:glyoxylase-like metal-dependent hydrolase (beta-lactamase superfamily II)/rhodanese-related sulfurtransferase
MPSGGPKGGREGPMFFRQYDLACLSLYSYLVGDSTTGRAVVVDPQRDVDHYLADAAAAGLRIERVIETHFHADFLSGHLELAAATGAVISYGDRATADFPIEPLAHGQRLVLGEVVLEIRHTPGHTPESVSIVIREHPDGDPWAVLTGDTLFIGDVGRPDLLTSVGWSADGLARDLYRSLHDELLSLPDDTLVFPAHGAGSACGKQLGTAASSTIGEQRRTNYALQPMTIDAFVDAVTEGQGAAPLYFAFAADANRRARELLAEHPPPAIGIDAAVELAAAGAVLLDTRAQERFAAGHVRGSINVGLDGRFAEYAGDVVRPGQQVVLLGEPGTDVEAAVRLARIGFDAVVGTVDDVEAAIADRPDLAEQGRRLTATELAELVEDAPRPLQVVDVRSPTEAASGTVAGARVLPLPQLLDLLGDLDPDAPTVVYCAGGYRSSVAASTLRAHGFTDVADLLGGYAAWAAHEAAHEATSGTGGTGGTA